MQQYDLFFGDSIHRKFLTWITSDHGNTVLTEFISRAKALKRAGFRQYGAKAIVEGIRFDWDVKCGPGPDGFKINNNYTSRLARYAMRICPELDGFFELREMRN
jgi:hypothetical protein